MTLDDELSDGGYSSRGEFKNKEILPHRYKIKRSRFRENYPSLLDYPNERGFWGKVFVIWFSMFLVS